MWLRSLPPSPLPSSKFFPTPLRRSSSGPLQTPKSSLFWDRGAKIGNTKWDFDLSSIANLLLFCVSVCAAATSHQQQQQRPKMLISFFRRHSKHNNQKERKRRDILRRQTAGKASYWWALASSHRKHFSHMGLGRICGREGIYAKVWWSYLWVYRVTSIQ